MNDRDRILERIKAVQALAERGERGEKDNAAAMLERLMKQYGITESELAEDRRELAWFRFKTPLERRLLNQIIYAALEKELDRFYSAFLNKNHIFPENPIDEIPDTDEIDLEEAQRLSMMMAGMEEHTRRKALGSGTAERDSKERGGDHV